MAILRSRSASAHVRHECAPKEKPPQHQRFEGLFHQHFIADIIHPHLYTAIISQYSGYSQAFRALGGLAHFLALLFVHPATGEFRQIIGGFTRTRSGGQQCSRIRTQDFHP